jgi:RNA polymerase sigma-70 factor, ECF subfamily
LNLVVIRIHYVKMLYRNVFALSLGMLCNVQDAEDATQEAILRGLQNISKLPLDVNFEAWLLQIAKNLCIDFLRRKSKLKVIVAEPSEGSKTKSNENHNLQRALGRLPQELRLPLIMYYFQQKNGKNIAEKLNISHSGACKRIRDARKMLHEILTERAKNE